MALKSKKLKKLVYLLTLFCILSFNDDTLFLVCVVFLNYVATIWLATVMEKPMSSFQISFLLAITLALTNNFVLLICTIILNCFINAQIMVDEKWAFLRFWKRFGLTAIASVLAWLLNATKQSTMKTGDELSSEFAVLMTTIITLPIFLVISLGTFACEYLFAVWMGRKHSPPEM